MEKSKVLTQMWETGSALALKLNLILWDVKFENEGGERYLRFFIDKVGGVFIDDCEAFHKEIDIILDEIDPIDTSYTLEVSSPGIERELSRPEHFQKYIGENIKLRLFHAINGKKLFIGKLVSANQDEIVIFSDETEQKFSRKLISKLTLDDDIVF